jgi:hypothetical protein
VDKARFTNEDEARVYLHYSRLLDRIEVKSTGIYQAQSVTSSEVRVARANSARVGHIAVSPVDRASIVLETASRAWQRRRRECLDDLFLGLS